jgi:hypothetical protein
MRAKLIMRENSHHETAIQNEGVPRQVPQKLFAVLLIDAMVDTIDGSDALAIFD